MLWLYEKDREWVEVKTCQKILLLLNQIVIWILRMFLTLFGRLPQRARQSLREAAQDQQRLQSSWQRISAFAQGMPVLLTCQKESMDLTTGSLNMPTEMSFALLNFKWTMWLEILLQWMQEFTYSSWWMSLSSVWCSVLCVEEDQHMC